MESNSVGYLANDRYLIEKSIGEGAEAFVYKCEDKKETNTTFKK